MNRPGTLESIGKGARKESAASGKKPGDSSQVLSKELFVTCVKENHLRLRKSHLKGSEGIAPTPSSQNEKKIKIYGALGKVLRKVLPQ